MPEPGAVVFWDFDGTLATRDGLWSGALADAVRIADPDSVITREQLRDQLRDRFPWHRPDLVGEPVGADVWWQRLHPVLVRACTEAGVGPGQAVAAADLVRTEYYRPARWTVVDGAFEALALVRGAGLRNVILSNHAPELPGLVTALGFDPLVEAVITSAAVGAEKPNPAIFGYAFALTGAEVTASWMIGDNPVADVEGARGVGLRAVLADAAHPDPVGVTVLDAARRVVDSLHS